MKQPAFLQKGDKIGLVCPAGFMLPEKYQTCVEQLRSWGYEPVLGSTMHSGSASYFSGTDAERLADLQQMLNDDSIRAILCGRGGYGCSHLVDRLDFSRFAEKPKWLIGFSDITILHLHIVQRYKIATLHAPMAAAFNDGEYANSYVQSLRRSLEGIPAKYTVAGHPFNRSGKARGRLIGGNLSLLAHVIGTASAPVTRGRILFIEDVGEYAYNIDRMMIQLKRAGWFDGLAGLIIGGFTETKDTERPFGKTVYELIRDLLSGADYPVCFGFPVSHDRENLALKEGVKYELVVKENEVKLKED
ncbi:MAG: LD-carboxypeptidase [Flavihumibacter sp.]